MDIRPSTLINPLIKQIKRIFISQAIFKEYFPDSPLISFECKVGIEKTVNIDVIVQRVLSY
jgi:hypothetical protein